MKATHIMHGNLLLLSSDGLYEWCEESRAWRSIDTPNVMDVHRYDGDNGDDGCDCGCGDHSVDATDMVNHPPHYQSDDGIECIDAIRAALGSDGLVAYCRGAAIKYAWRSGKKSQHAEDLKKAAWYLERAAKELEK